MKGPFAEELIAPHFVHSPSTIPAIRLVRQRRYMVVKEFVDSDGDLHAIGEQWLFWAGTFNRFEDEYIWYVEFSPREVRRISFFYGLATQRDVIDQSENYVTAVEGAARILGERSTSQLEQIPVQIHRQISASVSLTNSIGVSFVLVQPGFFVMGSPVSEERRIARRETPHTVRLTKPFNVGMFLVTRGQFAAFVKATNFLTDAEKEGWAYCLAEDGVNGVRRDGANWRNPGYDQNDDHPVVEVSWNDVKAFCRWLSEKEKRTYRLPTEAEWEYVCRAGTTTAYFWGETADDGEGFANCADLTAKGSFPGWNIFNWRDGFVFTSPIGSFKPNPWGFYDMIGNVAEWCEDRYGPYPQAEQTDPTSAELPLQYAARVFRGGSWHNAPGVCRCAYRSGNPPDLRNDTIGFRLCMDAL